MALTTQLIVKIAGNADGAIAAMAKLGKGSRDAFKEVSTSAKVEFERARKEAERAYKDVARLQKEAANAGKGGHSDLANALSSEAARRAVEADKAAAAVVAAEKRIAAESIKTGAITKTALAGGASGAGAAFAREGGAISRVFGTIRTEATKTGAAIKTGLSSGAFEGIGKSAAVAGAGILAGFGFAEKATIGFDKALSGVKAVLNGTNEDLARLRQAALDAGAATVFTASDAARAEGELAKAGVALKDILGGGLTGALNLAAAGQIDLGEAATIAAQAMTTFGLSGGDVGHIADVLAAGANKSTASVQSLAEGLSESGGVAAQFGFSIEDTVATLALFDQNAIRGAEGGNALKTMLLKLGAPSKVAADEMKKLGIAVYDSQGAIKPASALMDQLRSHLSGLSDEQKNAALQTIFGTRAIRGAAVALKEGAGGFLTFRKAVNDSGAASRFASVQMDNLAGDLERLKGSIEVGLIGAGEGASGVLRSIAGSAEDAVNAFGSLPSGVQGVVGILTALSGAALVAGGSVAFLAPKVAAARVQLEALGPAGAAASKGLGLLGRAAGAATVLFAIGEGLNLLGNEIDRLANGKTNLSAMGEALAQFSQNGKVTGELAKQLGADLGELPGKLKQLDTKGIDFLKNSTFRDARKDVDALDKALAGLVKTGSGGKALAGDLVGDIAKKAGIPVADLKKKLNDYRDAVSAANAASKFEKVEAAAGHAKNFGSAADKAAQATSDLAKNQEALQQAADDAAQALSKELDQLTSLTDLTLGVSNSNIAFVQSLGDLKKSLEDNGKSFDINTEAGQKNQSALNDAIAAADAHATAVGQETGSLEQANFVLQGHRQQLIDAATAALGSRDAATKYVDELLKIPPTVSTKVTADTGGATAAIQSFSQAVEAARRATANAITVKFAKQDPFNLAFSGNLGLNTGKFAGRFAGGPTTAREPYQVAERGPELWIPRQKGHKPVGALEHLAKQAKTDSSETLVRLGIPGGIEPKATRKGSPALLLGTQGPQMFTPPADGVVVNATDTKRLERTNDPGLIERILKKAGLDKRSIDALAATSAPARATGGKVQQGEMYKVNEKGLEAFAPKFNLGGKGTTPAITTPGVKRGSDGSYNITIGDTHLKVEAGTSGSAKGINKSDVDKIVERKQAELVQELIAAMRSG